MSDHPRWKEDQLDIVGEEERRFIVDGGLGWTPFDEPDLERVILARASKRRQLKKAQSNRRRYARWVLSG